PRTPRSPAPPPRGPPAAPPPPPPPLKGVPAVPLPPSWPVKPVPPVPPTPLFWVSPPLPPSALAGGATTTSSGVRQVVVSSTAAMRPTMRGRTMTCFPNGAPSPQHRLATLPDGWSFIDRRTYSNAGVLVPDATHPFPSPHASDAADAMEMHRSRKRNQIPRPAREIHCVLVANARATTSCAGRRSARGSSPGPRLCLRI